MKLSTLRLIGVSTLMAALLVGCGGGDDAPVDSTNSTGGNPTGGSSTTTEASTKYVGTWVTCSPDGLNSEREVITITKASANVVSLTFDLKGHSGTSCGGAGTPIESGGATVTIAADTITVGGETTDKLDVVVTSYTGPESVPIGTTAKWIGRATATQMFIGYDQPSASAYPTAFQDTYTKL